MVRVLFVCLGNICRSPAAEGIFKAFVEKAGLNQKISVDSAGTSAYHAGDQADPRMREHARERGYDLTSISRGFEEPEDFENFDYIITMDETNFADIADLDPKREYMQKVTPMVNFCTLHKVPRVPDPYYGGDDGFRLVLDILEDACTGLLAKIRLEKKF